MIELRTVLGTVLWFHLSLVAGLLAQEASVNATVELEAVEALARGPIHEAFVETTMDDPQPAMLVDKEPPEDVNELPPDVRPDGSRVVWIPGYWLWNEDRDDFVWVSGVWRNAPPGRSWIPGYWSRVEGGFQRIPGFWAAEDAEEVDYLPAPPSSLEAGANQPALSSDQFWIPGNWIWQGNGYVWQPGYLSRNQADWIWVPSRYGYTPRGAVFVPGYWDYPLEGRGWLFAPVHFRQPLYMQPGYRYQPQSLIDPALLISRLFFQPRSRHFFYGNYFGANDFGRGYYPWYDYDRYYRGYDSLFQYYGWFNSRQRNDLNWHRDLIKDYQRLAKQMAKGPTAIGGDFDRVFGPSAKPFMQPWNEFAKGQKSVGKLQSAYDVEKRIKHVKNLGAERKQAEMAAWPSEASKQRFQQSIPVTDKRQGKVEDRGKAKGGSAEKFKPAKSGERGRQSAGSSNKSGSNKGGKGKGNSGGKGGKGKGT